ncbi:DoxX family protein [Thermomonospora cellulosilytica]|uniref:Putative oxidoreductase n=1 Tax=Thermomonospora cellulosilytica TaxID=1411118 RepID=A0A7W3MTU0_9ACTN|nr:DoxX family protein [Thermomonospora cellulosilytica]MBA9001766.1 putative oxidoreductase [Thermomonospora cellulosilytica]
MNFADRFPVLRDIGLLIGRLALGVILLAHGLQKLTDIGLGAVARGFDDLGIPLPTLAAYYATWVEILGGLALILGLLVPVAGVLIALDMAGAYWFVHRDDGLFVNEGGFEFVLLVAATALLLAGTGSGRFGLDALLWRGRTPARGRAETSV